MISTHPCRSSRPHRPRSRTAFAFLIGMLGTFIAISTSPAETLHRLTPRDTTSLQRRINESAPGDIIELAAGIYELDAPLRIMHALTIRARDGAPVVLSGGRALSLQWQDAGGDVLSARIPDDIDLDRIKFDQLFLDGVRQHLARYPNYDRAQRYFGGTAADALSDERIRSWRDPQGGFIHSLHRAKWGGNHWRIAGRNADGTLALEGGWMNNRPSGINPEHRFVENIREELDAPGEWYLDREARMLYLYPPAGADLQTAEVTVSGLERLIEIIGESAGDPLEGVRIDGIQLKHTARTFMQTNDPLLRSDWMIHRGGAIHVENARDVTIDGCVFRALGGNAVFVSGHARGINIRTCHFTDVGASGICFVGRPEAVRSPSFNYHEFLSLDELDRQPGPRTEDYPRDCVVEDCLMHDLGMVEKQVAGVQISMASRITVRHVSIYDVPRAGINISEGTWGGHLIEGCDVFDTVQMTGDHGSFNSWGRDRFWHPDRAEMDRITRDHPELILLDARETTTIRNSRWRCDHGWDIDLDDGSSNYDIYNNLCLNGGIKLREGFHRHVHNNIMVNNSFHPHVWFEDSHDVFEKNIVMTWYKPIRLAGWGDSIDYNLLPDDASLARSHELGLDEHSAAGDPKFIDPANGDFRVKPDSPALTLGFENFPMDRFGVQSPHLRAIARTPTIPSLGIGSFASDVRPRTFLGATVKALRGLGERSATGMDADRGVLVLSVPPSSIAHAGGLKPNDVILRVGGFETNHPGQLQPAYLKTSAADTCPLSIFRDQRTQTLTIPGGRAIRLSPEGAKITGAGRHPVYDPDKDFLGSWTDFDTALAWEVEYHGRGEYDVYIDLAAPAESAGATWSFTIAGQTLEGKTPDTGGWEQFERIHLGRVTFERYGGLHVELAPREKTVPAVMNLRGVELIAR